MKRLLFTILLFSCGQAVAQCSGSGLTWSCAAGTTGTQVNTALASASDGATLTFAAGSYHWGSEAGATVISLSTTKGVTLICATPQACNVVTQFNGIGQNFPTVNTKLVRISGFAWTTNGSSQYIFNFCSGGSCGSGGLSQLRIDHNTFTLSDSGHVMNLGDGASTMAFFGSFDHNTITCATSCSIADITGALNNSPAVDSLGTGNNLFIEDNTITITSMTNSGLGCIDGWSSTFRVVVRHNTSTNCLWTSHGVPHSGGPDTFEFYNNDVRVNSGATGELDCFRCFHHQGSGMSIFFNNQFTSATGASGAAMQMLHYRDYCGSTGSGASCTSTFNMGGNNPYYCDGTSTGTNSTHPPDGNRSPIATYRGYPCWHQPGRSNTTAAYKPMYAWNNFWAAGNPGGSAGTKVPLDVPDGAFGSPDYQPNHLQADRDFYNSVSVNAQNSSSSPFNGTTGMGFGTLANRPSTCTTSSESAFSGAAGVGYAAGTTQGTIGASATEGTASDYVLYTCSATNTWTQFYQPYTYPNPLIGGVPLGTPSFSPNGGTFTTAQSEALTCAVGATACFTRDGTTPTSDGAGTCTHGSTYSTPYTINSNETDKALCTQSGQADSTVATSNPFAFVGITSYNPSSKNFGNVQVNIPSTPQVFIMTNTSAIGASLTFGSITTTGTDALMFAISNDTCSGQTVAALGTCSFTYTFTPTSVGAKSAAASIPSNATTSADTVNMNGTGTQTAGAPSALSSTGIL